MDLFRLIKVKTECYLCGCDVANNMEPVTSTDSNNKQHQSPIICQYCHLKLPLSDNLCTTCGLPLYINLNGNKSNVSGTTHSKVCGSCLINSPIFNRVVSAFHYEQPISDFITHLKYSGQLHLAPILSDYLTCALKRTYKIPELPQLVIPVPLHRKKIIKRGFNQSRLIANLVSNSLNIEVLNNGCERIKETQAQSGLDSTERKANIKNAFEISIRLPAHVAIVDDVVTTGMTVSELTEKAISAGAERVDVWCIARAYSD